MQKKIAQLQALSRMKRVKDRAGPADLWGKGRLFKEWCWENWLSNWKKNKIGPWPYTFYRKSIPDGLRTLL